MELKLCPMCNEKPYVATFDRGNGCLVCQTAQVICNCGVSGPERYGPERKKDAISSWNSRAHDSDLRKLAEKWRNGPPYPRDPDKLAIWQGECNCADELDKLLD